MAPESFPGTYLNPEEFIIQQVGIDLPPEPVGNDFQINDLETGFQTAPDVTALLTGGFAAVWLGPAPEDPSISAVLLRIFSPDGIPLASDRRVSGLFGGTRANPRVAADAVGNALVAWTENLDIMGRWYGSDGDPLGEEFFINAFRFNGQQLPAIVAFGDRQAVAVWESLGAFQDVDGWSIKMRILGPSGPIDPGQDEDILVNLETVGSQVAPSIAMSSSGLIVVWAQQPGTIRARRFSVGGTGADHEIVDISAPVGSTQPVVAMTSDGGFVVGWSTGADLLVRLYGPDDNPLSQEFSLGFLPGSSGLDLQADGSDSFMSAAQGIAGSLNDVFGRRFRPDGTAIGDPNMMNSHASLNQLGPAIGMNPSGSFIVVWESQTAPPGEDNDGTSIRGRLFELAPGSDP